MTAIPWALFAAALVGCGALYAVLARHDWKTGEAIADLEWQRYEDAALIAMLRREIEFGQAAEIHLRSRLREVEAKLATAVREAEQAATVTMLSKQRDQDEWLESLQAWQFIANAAALLHAQPTPALPAGETKAIEAPKALPRGAGFLVGADLILPADDAADIEAGFHYFADRLPARQAVSS